MLKQIWRAFKLLLMFRLTRRYDYLMTTESYLVLKSEVDNKAYPKLVNWLVKLAIRRFAK